MLARIPLNEGPILFQLTWGNEVARQRVRVLVQLAGDAQGSFLMGAEQRASGISRR